MAPTCLAMSSSWASRARSQTRFGLGHRPEGYGGNEGPDFDSGSLSYHYKTLIPHCGRAS